jgi:hypothetical protein
MKPPKPLKNAHASNSKHLGNMYQGGAIRAKTATMKESMLSPITPDRNKGKPPRKLA